ncbi:TonB-dependent receptor plug domain-containing protein [Caulobacter sp. CCUG 60055]|uniref:TonB-dependent receptor plug domain-containing protein n=1 Tax=Caulobacter sp. CCUG 60055 TaxID=2100090 RepID=UPI001FA79ED3|nr:TonB-dependent receptor plug domain-containing protein [Caulobacter sp. CCUG 60055]
MHRQAAPERGHRRRNLRGASLAALLVAAPAGLFADLAHAEGPDEAAAVDGLTIVGQRLGSAKAIEAQKNAKAVVSVISADDLGKLPDANVADALARVPGVNVVVNQETGEGEYVTVRGFAGTYNAYSINGVRVALTDPASRRMSMTMLPPNGLQAITVAKTLTPDMDGDAIGGSVDFRTPTAFDFRKPTVRLFGAYGINDRARDQGERDGSGQIQADFATRFGDAGQFGFFASVNYGKSHGLNEETENDGEWEPYRWRKNSTETIDDRSMYLPGIDLDYRRVEQTRYGGNFSLDYRGGAHDFYLRGQYNRFERVSNNDYTDFRSRPTLRLVQANADDANLVQPENNVVGVGAKGRIYGYTTSQIVDQDGDGVITDADRKSKSYWSLYGRSGVWSPQAFQMARTFQVQDQNQTLATVNFGGASRLGRLSLDYDLSYSWGDREEPDNYSVGYDCDACSAPFNQTGLLWSSFDPRFPMPQLPAFAQNADRDDSLLPFSGASLSRNKQTDQRVAARLDAKYQTGGLVDFVKAGVKITRSSRDYDSTPVWSGSFAGTSLDGKNLAQSGLVERHVERTRDPVTREVVAIRQGNADGRQLVLLRHGPRLGAVRPAPPRRRRVRGAAGPLAGLDRPRPCAGPRRPAGGVRRPLPPQRPRRAGIAGARLSRPAGGHVFRARLRPAGRRRLPRATGGDRAAGLDPRRRRLRHEPRVRRPSGLAGAGARGRRRKSVMTGKGPSVVGRRPKHRNHNDKS